jgi:hypothetical protein
LLAVAVDPVAKGVFQQGEGDHHQGGDGQQGAPVATVELECRAQDLADASRGEGGHPAVLANCLAHV